MVFDDICFMKKIEKKDWFIAGLDVLETSGFQKITIDSLCVCLKITQGSFYHHFGNIDGYIEALMKFWMDENTKSLIEEADKRGDAKGKMEALNNMVMTRSQKSEQVIRGWSFANAIVERYVRKVDDIRLKYLVQLREQYGEDVKTAKLSAMLEYACLTGIQQLYPYLPKVEMKELYELFYSKNKKNK